MTATTTTTTPPTTPTTADTSIRAVVFDWAGTIVDFGSLAPMGAFVRLFAKHGITISVAQARVPMGLPKLAHIAALGAMPEIAAQWQLAKGRGFGAADAADLLQEFVPMSAASALEHSDFIPGFLDSYAWLQQQGMGVATTTGYTRCIMEPLIALAAEAGFAPARVICCDDVAQSRPSPLGMQACMETLGLAGQSARVVKVDDTVPGLQEGINAGCWTVAVAASGNALGWSWDQWVHASEDEREHALVDARAGLRAAGAHEVIDSVADLRRALTAIEARAAAGQTP
jgi:phosphonoacetaldehyde hydrolase